MPIEDFLGKGEEILGKYGFSERRGIYYATNKRVIKWRKKLIGEDFSDLAYRNITSLTYTSSVRKGLIALRSNTTIGGGLFTPSLTMFLLLIGIIVMILGFVFKKTQYKFHAPGLTGSEAKKWDFGVPWYKSHDKAEAKKFAYLVRERLQEA